ncbi:MAG: type II secretion system ATPase GspE [Armatimonadota bacterium]
MPIEQSSHAKNMLTSDQLRQAKAVQHETGQTFDEILVNLGFCTQESALEVLARQAGLPLVHLVESNLDPQVIALIPTELAFRHQVLPLQATASTLRVAIADPFNTAAADDLRLVTGRDVELVFAPPQDIRRFVEEFYTRRMIADTAEDDVQVLDDTNEEIGDLESMAKEATVVKLVNLLLRQAVQERASDVHVEPFEKGMQVRYRIDGILHAAPPTPKRLQAAIISRLKIMAALDIAERRKPQDGRIKTRIAGREIDIRVSTVPTLYGESVVLRLLDRSAMNYTLAEIGMLPNTLRKIERLITLPHGMILATGPTGSGKTTTLYGSLRATYSTEKKILTIEDPIEYQLDGVNQIQVHPQIGLTFATGLRHILRQDPDIIMVGEIRDAETAEIAVHSALTGHLVFSTLHTNDAASAVTRLLEMGIEPYLVSSSVEAVVAQRLVRTICTNCKEPRRDRDIVEAKLAEADFPVTDRDMLYIGRGCEQCKHSGYRGRTGIYELLLMENALRPLVMERAPASAIRQFACQHGMKTLREDGWQKVLRGITTVEEVLRVTRQDDIEPVED